MNFDDRLNPAAQRTVEMRFESLRHRDLIHLQVALCKVGAVHQRMMMRGLAEQLDGPAHVHIRRVRKRRNLEVNVMQV